MKGPLFGVLMAASATGANAEFATPNITRFPDLVHPSDVVRDVKAQADCIRTFVIDDNPRKMADMGPIGSTLVENKLILERCIADVQETLKGLGDSEIKSDLEEDLYVMKQVMGNMDAFDPQDIEQRIQFLEEKLFQHEKESYYTMLIIILLLGVLIGMLILNSADAKMGRHQELKNLLNDIVNSKNDEQLSGEERRIIQLLKKLF